MAYQKTVKSVERFFVYWVKLDPAVGREIQKTRPCVIISPDDLNNALDTIIVAPLSTVSRRYPYRVTTVVKNTHGQVALDQMRCIDKSRLGKRVGRLSALEAENILHVLAEMFAP